MTILRDMLGSKWCRGAVGALAACMIAGAAASAADQPDQLITGRKLLVKSNSGDTSKNKIVFISKDDSFTLPDASNDPTATGAVLRVLDLGGGAGAAMITLAAANWKALPTGFKYKGNPGDPCKTVIIKDDKLVKIVCKGASVTLAPPFTGAAALALEVGTMTIRYCATFPLPGVKNVIKPNGKGLFKAKAAPAPAACLSPCGNGTLDAGESCDDGNNVSGDCCSATCVSEPSGGACNDGNSCTLNDQCDGSGACSGAPACGNDTLDAACGEQCDGSDDAACPGHCLPNCSCAPEPTCAGRTLFAGGPQTAACHTYDGNQGVCEQAFHLGNGGVASCYYDVDDDECRGCGPLNQADGACVNACNPPTCVGDPSRTAFAGGPGTGACQAFGLIAGTANCDIAFHIGGDGVASCYYDPGDDQCEGCGAQNQADGNCVNTCAACTNDPSRTIFAGGSNTQACRQFDGDQASCEQAFHRDQCRHDVSCFYDQNSGDCRGCGPSNEGDGQCRNTCADGPVVCTNDPSRTIDLGGPETSACHTYDGDPVNCQKSFHRTQCNQPTSCYYDFSADECRGCGASNEFGGACINTCVAGPVTCPQDPSRTILAGLPNSQGCQEFGLSAGTAACETAFNIGDAGAASCFNDGFNCRGCGPPNEGNGECRNTCTQGLPACPADPTRTIYAGGPNTQACRQFDGDQTSCEQAFHIGQAGVASCYYAFGDCLGCGPSNEVSGDCSNTCNPPTCPGDLTRTIFAGGPQSSACHIFDGDQTNCLQAYHQGFPSGGIIVASCYYDSGADECKGCGPTNQDSGDCVNTCPVCPADASRTVFAGGPGTGACQQFDGNQTACETAFHFDQYGHPTSCYFTGSGDCRGCGPNNFANGECQNTCVTGPPTCEKDPARTIYAGGPGTPACHQFDADPISCLKAFHSGQQGGIASCFYDSGAEECAGCETGNSGNGECLNTCQHGVPACAEDPTRTVFTGYPNTSACHVFDDDPAGCATAYHLDQCNNPASCYYDVDNNRCNGCGPNNLQNGECINTCKTGPASCDSDPSRILFGGVPGSGACGEFDDQIACLAAFHIGQCGVASCYWTGASCQGCGPNNLFNGQCFNTCQAP